MISNFKKFFSVGLISITLSVLASAAWGRAGGAGGGHSGGGGHGSGGGFSHSSGYSGGHVIYVGSANSGNSSGGLFFFFCIVILVVVLLIYDRRRKNRGRGYNDEPFLPSASAPTGPPLEPALAQKVGLAFITIQKSWSEKRLDLMRRFITDGVYQRFNAQFTMMNAFDQTDVMQNVIIQKLSVAEQRSDGNYDVVTVRILASADDQFVSLKYPVLDSPGGTENFVEYWSFIRRKDYKKGFDLFHADVCPQCAAPLKSQLVETARCPYCGTYLNNGEYDWVLAEITQENDYKASAAFQVPNEIAEQLPDFSKQLIEDRASNAFTQILIATVTKKRDPLLRFTSARAQVDLNAMMNTIDFMYDRLFLNAVDVESCSVNDGLFTVRVEIVYSFRRVRIENRSAVLLDDEMITELKTMTMVREVGAGTKSLGSIYANSCSHCGAAQKDSLSSACAYCGQALNDPKTEWVVDQIE